mmetsp:Transcript_28513/g.67930  ORF Transcript_28513/g.67930 Transcript_28513/m.67930 type:complete len:273 (-) Transcript_28513:389-1207(-)
MTKSYGIWRRYHHTQTLLLAQVQGQLLDFLSVAFLLCLGQRHIELAVRQTLYLEHRLLVDTTNAGSTLLLVVHPVPDLTQGHGLEADSLFEDALVVGVLVEPRRPLAAMALDDEVALLAHALHKLLFLPHIVALGVGEERVGEGEVVEVAGKLVEEVVEEGEVEELALLPDLLHRLRLELALDPRRDHNHRPRPGMLYEGISYHLEIRPRRDQNLLFPWELRKERNRRATVDHPYLDVEDGGESGARGEVVHCDLALRGRGHEAKLHAPARP